MIAVERKKLEQVLEALHYCEALNRSVEQQKMQAITFIKEALAQPDPLVDAGKPIEHIDVLKLALDLAIMHHSDDGYAELRAKVHVAAKAALAQPAQEPVAWKWFCGNRMHIGTPPDYEFTFEIKPEPLYTAPPKRPWVGLTDEEIDSCWYQSGGVTPGFARATEAKLKEKNFD